MSSASGQRIELRHTESAEIEKWAKTLSACKKSSQNISEDRKRKRPLESSHKPETSNKVSREQEKLTSVGSESPQTKSQAADDDIDDGSNLLKDIAGSNLSEDEYDPEEDTMEQERSRQKELSLLKSEPVEEFKEGISVDNTSKDGGANEVRTSKDTDESGSRFERHDSYAYSSVVHAGPVADGVNTVQPNGPPWYRAFIQFDEGSFQLRDRPALKYYFEKYGEVVDVFLPSTNRKVISSILILILFLVTTTYGSRKAMKFPTAGWIR